jgi:phosphoglycolate phosphatase
VIKLACLDLAGTTVQDDGAVMDAFAAALGEIGLEPGTPEHERATVYTLTTMGQSKIEVFRAITDQAERANLAFEKAYQASLSAGGAQPIPGAEQAIRDLRDRGVKVALTTGFSPTTRSALLDALGWADLVDLALSPVDAGRGRPWPDLVLTALIRLGVDDVREVCVAGDTTSDLLTGSRAGAAIVAGVLTGAHGPEDFANVPHTHVLESVADLPAVVAQHEESR